MRVHTLNVGLDDRECDVSLPRFWLEAHSTRVGDRGLTGVGVR